MSVPSAKVPGVFGLSVMGMVGGLGAWIWAQWRELRQAAGMIGMVLAMAAQTRRWVRPARRVFVQQVLVMGIEPLWFVGAVAAFVGISVVVQLALWVGEAGQSQMLGPVLVAVVARELGPVLITLIVIVRSGSAMTTELGILKINGEIRGLEAQDDHSFSLIVMPRILGMVVSTFCLTIVFIFAAFASGYLFAVWLGIGIPDLLQFMDTVSGAVQAKDVSNIFAKSVLPALFAGASCCAGGLGVCGTFAAIPGATQRALTRSVAGLFFISAVISLLTYL